MILHELAHAYHDQVLGFEEPRIKAAYEKYKKSGHGDKTLLHDGRRVKHYALTDQMEFFAEMTEAYFGVNDFFPFNRAELKQAEPEIYSLLKDVWEGRHRARNPSRRRGGRSSSSSLRRMLRCWRRRPANRATPVAAPWCSTALICSARAAMPGEDTGELGPDLAKAGKEATDVYLVESVLLPSKVIKKGFETVTITTKAGKTSPACSPRSAPTPSCCATPPGRQADHHPEEGHRRAQRQGAVADAGRARQRPLRPAGVSRPGPLPHGDRREGPGTGPATAPRRSLFAPPPLPEYERDLDHAGLIRALDGQSFKRGEAIYVRVCANCHGTQRASRFDADLAPLRGGQVQERRRPVSHVPDADARLRHDDARRRGWCPQQKYDVIHYIREAYLKPHNPGQYAKIDDAYLAGLPKGTSRGPKPSNIEPWVSMNYGPSLMATLEVGDRGNFAYKGIAVRLDNGPGGVSRGRHWMLFDHDTLRVAAAWSGDGLHRLERHQLQRPASDPSPRRRERSTSPTRSAPAGPIPRPAVSTTRG